ncbi:MAG: AsmA family protein [Burkholderiales bacterium]
MAAAVVGALIALCLSFDWNWLRGPLNTYITKKTHREFTSSDLKVRLGFVPTIRLQDVTFANASWGQGGPMARIGMLEFSVSLRDLFDGKVLVPRVALTDAQLRFEQLADHRRNWILSDPNDTSPSGLRISSLSVTRGGLSYVDHGVPLALQMTVATFDPAMQGTVSDAKAAPDNRRYTTRYAFKGTYHDAAFSGDALTGDVLSFQESGIVFPLRGSLFAGTTRLNVEGTVADVAKISAIDVRLRMAGETLANLYPFLLLPLPASPPYRLTGHLTLRGSRYALDEISGQIGTTDVTGQGAYFERQPRPLLQARLHSELLNVADLGPLVGITTKASRDASPPTQAQTNTRAAARASEQAKAGERVLPAGTPAGERLLPTGKFEGGRLKAIDADAELTAKRVKAPDKLEVTNVNAVLHLKGGVLKLQPLDVDFAGGRILSTIDLDARQPVLSARTDIRLARVKMSKLLPQSQKLAPSQALLDGRLVLAGHGNSIADAAAKADGHIGAALSQGEVSNLLDAAAGLNGGKVLALLLGGDKQIPMRCGAMAFDVKAGQGASRLFVVDTEQTRIDGAGRFDLDRERFEAKISPKPKHPGILSLRSPVRLFGSFRHPDYELDKASLAMRAGGAIALGLVAPVAALIPLIETGPGADVDCARVSASALAVASAASASAPRN